MGLEKDFDSYHNKMLIMPRKDFVQAMTGFDGLMVRI